MRSERCKVLTLVLATVGALILADTANAQNTGFAGLVRDSSGAVLPGVTVEASSPALIEKTRTTVTDGQGLYQIIDVRPGVYTLTFSLPGFATVKRDGLQLSAAFTATVNVEMSVGSVNETITVSGEAPNVDIRNVVQQRVLTEEVRQALPTARSMQTMGALIPGMIVTAANAPVGQDVGGLSGERGQLIIHGSRGGDMTIQLDGLPFNSVQGVGSTQYYTLNPAEAQEYQYAVGAVSADTMTGGVSANAIPKEGGNRYSGFLFAAHTTGALQSDNLTDELKATGLQSANPIERIYDYNGSFGGPLKRDALWFFGSFRSMDQNEQVTGMFRPIEPLSFVFNPALGAAGNVNLDDPAFFDSWLQSYGLRLTWQATQKNRFNVYAAHQPNGQTPQFISATRSYEAASLRKSPKTTMIQSSWKTPVTSRLFVDTSFMWFDNYFSQKETASWITPDVVSVMDTGTGMTYRSSPRYYNQLNHQPLLKSSAAYVTGTHALKVGADLQWGYTLFEANRRNLATTYVLQNGAPRQLSLIISPYSEQENFHSLALYGQDQWTLKRLTINAGIRYDYIDQSVPVQTSGPGPLTPFQTWPEIPDLVGWHDLSPRLGIAYDLFGDGKTALKATLSRYPVRNTTAFAAQNNPITYNLTATRPWTDANNDLIPQPNELGGLSNNNWGTGATTSSVDPELSRGWHKRQYNWETSVGIQHELLPAVAVNVAYVRRAYGNFTAVDNLAVTPENYSPFCINVPVDARLPEGGGNQICDVYDLNPDKRGQVQNYTTFSSAFGDQSETFNGVDVGVNARIRGRATISGGLSSGTSNNTGNALRNSTSACFVIDTPQQRFCDIDVPWLTQVKLLGTVNLPWDVNLGGSMQSTPGNEITAAYTINSAQAIGLGRPLTNGTFTVPLIQPGSMFNERVLQVDLRASKTFRVQGVRIRAMLDVANLTNASTVLLQNNTYGANWQRPSYILPGRLFKPSIELTF
jgi:Carboxypeptidase regulatory-like domain